jgi:hypothetical protein
MPGLLAASLRVLFARGDSLPLAHGLVWRDRLITPLHVIDSNIAAAGSRFAIGRQGTWSPTGCRLAVEAEVPATDVSICSVGDCWPVMPEISFIESPQRGQSVDVHTLTVHPGRSIMHTTARAAIREVVTVGRHSYRTACGDLLTVRGVTAVFVDRAMPGGTSGAPVCLAGSTSVVGFVHGNAAANRGDAVCLSTGPLVAALKVVSSAETDRTRGCAVDCTGEGDGSHERRGGETWAAARK